MDTSLSLSGTPTEPQNEEHTFQDGWKWSASLATFVDEHVRGHSLAVGTGKCPIATVNLDLANIKNFAAQDKSDFKIVDIPEDDALAGSIRSAITDGNTDRLYGRIKPDPPVGVDDEAYELFDGYAFRGNMFSIPFKNRFDTVMLDPPWKDLSLKERKQIILEAKKAAKMGGNIILNATWAPQKPTEECISYDERFRQQEDARGGCSIITFYEVIPEEISQLLQHHIDDTSELAEFLPVRFASPQSIDSDAKTDPRLPSISHRAYCCPLCGCSQLEQKRNGFLTDDDGTSSIYKCMDCRYPAEHSSVKNLGDKLKEKAERSDIDIPQIEYLSFTPNVVKHHLRSPEYPDPDSSLPWVPHKSEIEGVQESSTNGHSEDEETQEDILPSEKVNTNFYHDITTVGED